jgi:hypothetical protein
MGTKTEVWAISGKEFKKITDANKCNSIIFTKKHKSRHLIDTGRQELERNIKLCSLLQD